MNKEDLPYSIIYCRECGKQMEPYGHLKFGAVCKNCKVVAEIIYREMYSVKAV